MPLPWRKPTKKITRISQMVADLHSPKHAKSSLVVQTGFPTSLIDLFVKNRSRFQKQRNPTKKHHIVSDLLQAPPPSPSNVSPLPSIHQTKAPHDLQSVFVEKKDLGVLKDGNFGGVLDKVWKFNVILVLGLVLNLVLVVGLVLWVKKISVGIVLSVFVLLFIDFVAKSVASKLKNVTVLEQGSEIINEGVISEFCSASSLIEEIEVVQDREIEMDISGSEVKCIDREEKLGFLEIGEEGLKREVEDECKISEGRGKSRHRAELKSKMVKLFVPRKLRGKKKEKRGIHESEDLGSMEGVKAASFEIEEQERNVIQRSEVEQLVCIEDEGRADFGTTCSIVESGRRDSGAGNTECVVLVLIALIGLLGGKTISFLFTMAGCFMIKMVKKVKGRSVKRLGGVW